MGALGETWRSGTETVGGLDIEALRGACAAQRIAALVVASEAAVTLGALWFAFRLLRPDDPGEKMVGIAVAVFTIIVGGLALWARRGSFGRRRAATGHCSAGDPARRDARPCLHGDLRRGRDGTGFSRRARSPARAEFRA